MVGIIFVLTKKPFTILKVKYAATKILQVVLPTLH